MGVKPTEGAGEAVALAHIRLEEDGLFADLEVLDGTHLQPEHSPVKLYLAAPQSEADDWKAANKMLSHALADERDRTVAMTEALEDALSLITGEVSGPSQRDGVVSRIRSLVEKTDDPD